MEFISQKASQAYTAVHDTIIPKQHTEDEQKEDTFYDAEDRKLGDSLTKTDDYQRDTGLDNTRNFTEDRGVTDVHGVSPPLYHGYSETKERVLSPGFNPDIAPNSDLHKPTSKNLGTDKQSSIKDSAYSGLQTAKSYISGGTQKIGSVLHSAVAPSAEHSNVNKDIHKQSTGSEKKSTIKDSAVGGLETAKSYISAGTQKLGNVLPSSHSTATKKNTASETVTPHTTTEKKSTVKDTAMSGIETAKSYISAGTQKLGSVLPSSHSAATKKNTDSETVTPHTTTEKKSTIKDTAMSGIETAKSYISAGTQKVGSVLPSSSTTTQKSYAPEGISPHTTTEKKSTIKDSALSGLETAKSYVAAGSEKLGNVLPSTTTATKRSSNVGDVNVKETETPGPEGKSTIKDSTLEGLQSAKSYISESTQKIGDTLHSAVAPSAEREVVYKPEHKLEEDVVNSRNYVTPL
ncbi:hypothetical protein HK099_005924 [Clydaea vesicula]|uniref:Uncharacterized protein n=1 Tax=Clydaea vesicula TaxID=447962 RepID=A0AAD5XYK3_9FUNG|nr:hypothetical protein HK099_005924 [Clydaea vesicula]